ncbi:rRNA maturation RNase YbeY [Rufibacter glacialis]|uniref:Endoribonuclease YbeY n=1 Tax=Rufibacter glacialis TaxID=1259555 RepID=A0A5M8QF17_9BACT|nr:rRNA maturation RNase YbeY [Rufibacter glacialis]KAA6433563.1 rRNA maturation RNase YbeY [Rufibacter glacialis]GGK73031.1 endoribonuclease YbeY [Rufibacter glacialis]
MQELPIEFFTEEVEFEVKNEEKVKTWLSEIISKYSFELESLNYIFCSDEYLHQMNVEYLEHDTLTDVITFDNSDVEGVIEGDVFISIDRIVDNAATFNISQEEELHRVMAHGLLHLLGFDDKTPEKKALMRSKENECLDSF